MEWHIITKNVLCVRLCWHIHSYNPQVRSLWTIRAYIIHVQQGKFEGLESCDRPIVRKRPIWVKIGDVLSRVTLKVDGWPWKTIGHLFNATSSFVHHFVAIGEIKLEKQSGNAQSGSNSAIFRAVWPWRRMTLKNNRAPLLFYFKLYASFQSHWCIKTYVGSNSTIFRAVWPWNLTDDLEKE